MRRDSISTFLLVFVGSLIASPLLGAGNRAGLLSEAESRQVGLERAWFTRVHIDSTQGRIAYLAQHVSSTESYTVFEVSYDGGINYFSERDLDRLGNPINRPRAEVLAKRRVEDLDRAQLHPQLTQRSIPLISLYVTTDRGIVQSIDAQTGRTNWVAETGRASRAVEAPGMNDQFVAAVNGSNLYLLNASDGKLVWQRKLSGATGAGPTLSDQLLFVPLLNGTIDTFELHDRREAAWSFRSTGRTLVPPTYNGSLVAWPTDRGHLYVAQGDIKNVLYQVSTNNPIVAAITALHPGRLLTASLSGYVYCIDELDGAVQWRFSTGERVERAPVVVGEAIYVVTEGGKLFRISGKTGLEDWSRWVTGITGLLTATQERLYCVGSTGDLLVINAETGGRIANLAADLPDLQITNQLTDRVFMATSGGVIQCFHELGKPWPTIHFDAAEIDAEEPELKAGLETETPAPKEPPAGEANPFGDPSDADPFGDPFAPGRAESDPIKAPTPAPSPDSDPFADTDPF